MPAETLCKGCGQPITGRYIVALGAMWHPAHFVCAGCGQPIDNAAFIPHQDKAYHEACYAQRIAPRCAYCGKALMSEYVVDYWGTQFCKEHEHVYPHCAYCGRLVSPQQQEQTPEEGIIRCPICRSTAIETAEEARPRFAAVKQWVSSQGLVYNNLPLSLELSSRAHLLTLLSAHHLTHAYGATLSASYTQNGQMLYTEVRGVAVLRGLPAALFQGVTVHELGHVWLIVHNISNLPTWTIEGFCELLAYRWHTSSTTPEDRYHALAIERRQDPIYGDGFRHLRAISERVGFPTLLHTLQTSKRLPG